jgi:hypothetical protein
MKLDHDWDECFKQKEEFETFSQACPMTFTMLCAKMLWKIDGARESFDYLLPKSLSMGMEAYF